MAWKSKRKEFCLLADAEISWIQRESLARANFEIKQHERVARWVLLQQNGKQNYVFFRPFSGALFSEGSEFSQGVIKDLFGGKIENLRYLGKNVHHSPGLYTFQFDSGHLVGQLLD